MRTLMNALVAGFGLSDLKRQNSGLQKQSINHFTKIGKKRTFTELAIENDYPAKAIHALKDLKAPKVKSKNPSIMRLKEMEKNNTLNLNTGMHPALKEAKDEILKLRLNLRKVEEQSTFWQRKTMNLRKELLVRKNKVTNLVEQVTKLEEERGLLQKKVDAAEKKSSTIVNALTGVIAENNELKETMGHMDAELNALMKSDAHDAKEAKQPENTNACIELEKALEDTMADLSDRLSEIEDLKKLLAKVTIEKNLLEKAVSKKQIIAEIVDVNLSEREDSGVSSKIAKLEEALEKCMFRIALLTQKNEELKQMNMDTSFISDRDARLMDVLEDDGKLAILESVCMQRYRTILKEAVEELVSTERSNESRCN